MLWLKLLSSDGTQGKVVLCFCLEKLKFYACKIQKIPEENLYYLASEIEINVRLNEDIPDKFFPLIAFQIQNCITEEGALICKMLLELGECDLFALA